MFKLLKNLNILRQKSSFFSQIPKFLYYSNQYFQPCEFIENEKIVYDQQIEKYEKIICYYLIKRRISKGEIRLFFKL